MSSTSAAERNGGKTGTSGAKPTADLDPLGRRDVRNQLLRHKERGATVLLNSHLLSEVERVCDRVAIVHEGNVLAVGAVGDLVPAGTDLESVFVDLIEKARGDERTPPDGIPAVQPLEGE